MEKRKSNRIYRKNSKRRTYKGKRTYKKKRLSKKKSSKRRIYKKQMRGGKSTYELRQMCSAIKNKKTCQDKSPICKFNKYNECEYNYSHAYDVRREANAATEAEKEVVMADTVQAPSPEAADKGFLEIRREMIFALEQIKGDFQKLGNHVRPEFEIKFMGPFGENPPDIAACEGWYTGMKKNKAWGSYFN